MSPNTSFSSNAEELNENENENENDIDIVNNHLLMQILGFQFKVENLIKQIEEYKECKKSVRDFANSVEHLNGKLKK